MILAELDMLLRRSCVHRVGRAEVRVIDDASRSVFGVIVGRERELMLQFVEGLL